ncbi:lecithin retinol acyltransferase family protein [Enterovibrio makurazakiensis]|uniref:Lecithin retinol acyltransferase family protein n=1 Tax=Enterovibrio gelatinilyticus TaxID=2899819 RepID=A0ABT5R3F1_9GAMM|nr:lecithin retinol acyltransferase family protein [Enterovibrio sp. ZSDZ42]MDD1794794.1 lecithin retinol acyltransferase family protein [Enterovibrio sp. ZSDZ42]
MNTLSVKPGDIVATDFGLYEHWSIVTDKLCDQGLYMLISATKRNGTVIEEPWNVVTQGKKTIVSNVSSLNTIDEMLQKARTQIGRWKYSVTDNNCEHFVTWASGAKVTSNQLASGLTGGTVGAGLVAACSENPTALKLLGGFVLGVGIGVAASKITNKSS